jgi:CrcB protein
MNSLLTITNVQTWKLSSDEGHCSQMMRVLLVGLGGFVGTLFRYWLSGLIAKRYGETFPLGTLAVNAIGCFIIGFLFYFFYDRSLTTPTARTVVLIGVIGGFTTFSSYGLQTFTLLRDGEVFLALVNVVASNVLGLALVWLGYVLAKAI